MLPYGTQPRWLEHLLQVGFHEDDDTCSVQTHRWKTVFCKTCMDGPICDQCCWTNSHKNHDILRVRLVFISTCMHVYLFNFFLGLVWNKLLLIMY